MKRPFSLFLLSAALSGPALAAPKELDGVYAPVNTPCPTVEEAIKKMTVPEGYAVRCFASEPMVVNPVAMTWDHKGRLWVVELYEYPSGAKQPNEYMKTAADEKFRPVVATGPGSPRDRVIVLEDTDNDGVADKRTVFVEGLSLATAILCGEGGVFVGQAPNLFFFRDTNGDDKADEYKTVLTGFGMEDRHELLNSFTWGPDGQMYFTHGVFTHSKVRRPGEKDDQGRTFNAGIYRVKFDGSKKETGPTVASHEVFSDGTSNPWGCDYDAAGNWFVEACVIDHLFHMAAGGLYQRQGGAPENPYAYELLPSIVNHKHFRAAYAGIQVYQGGAYPADVNGHLFFGNIHDNAIHEEKVEPVGATFKAAPVRDFLRANDGWFRPVSIQTGPDGFLWVMDWCDKYPCYQNAQANPEGVDREKGRIWRVCYVGNPEGASMAKRSRPEKLRIARSTMAERAAALSSPNSWVRRQMMQQIVQEERTTGTKKSVDEIEEAVNNAPALLRANADGGGKRNNDGPPIPADVRASSMQGLSALNALDRALLGGALNGPDVLRATVARVIGERVGSTKGDPDTDLLETLCQDPSPAVRHAAAIATRQLGIGSFLTVDRAEVNRPSIVSLLRNLITASAQVQDKTLPFAIWMALEPQVAALPNEYVPMLADLAPTTKPLSLSLTYKTMRRLCDTRRAENLDVALNFLDQVGTDGELVASALEGLVKGQEAGAVKPTKDMASHFEAWSKHERQDVRQRSQQLATLWGDPNAIKGLMGVALDPGAKLDDRVKAVQTVRKLKSGEAKAGLVRLLGEPQDAALTNELLRAAAEIGGGEFPDLILKAWTGYSASLRTTAAEVMTSRPEFAKRLLDAVEGKWVNSAKLDPATLPATVRRYFGTQAAEDQKKRARELLGSWSETPDDLKAVIAAKRKACLEGEPDLALGKTLFTAICGQCHEFHGGGQKVGPDLIGNGRSNLDALLANVITPNQIIGRGYENFLLTTKDGRTLSGRVSEDTPVRVKLLSIGGREEVVARDQIASLADTGQSLMPVGYGQLPDDQLRSLVWYILAPPEEGPLTKEKREALSRSVDTVVAAPPPARTFPRIDWESVSLWNPDWKVTAPEFEGTPVKLVEFKGRKNVLQTHPFPDKKTPSTLSRTLEVPADKAGRLKFTAAAGDAGDWELRVVIDGKEVKRQTIGHDGERWKVVEIDLAPWAGKKVPVSLENHANGWAWEFGYWSDIKVE